MSVFSVGGCGKQVRQHGEGIYCSHEDEDPMYVCTKMYDLVCIATDRHINAMTGMVGPERYLCRLSCQPGQSCPTGICCQGKVYGNNRGSDYACVPVEFCDNPPDAAPRDTRAEASSDVAPDSSSDGGVDDGGADSPAEAGGEEAGADGPADAPDDSTST